MKDYLLKIPALRRHEADYHAFRSDMKRMVVPVLIEQAAGVLMNLISTIIASQLGPDAISAVGSVGTINMLIVAVFSSISIGGTVVVAQYVGKGDHKRANRTVVTGLLSIALLTSVLIALILLFKAPLVSMLFGKAPKAVIEQSLIYLNTIAFWYLPYALTSMGLALLRGAGDMRSPMLVSLITNIVNLIIAYPLTYGFAAPSAGRGLRVTGAALSPIIAQTLGFALILFIFFKGTRSLSLREEKGLHIDWNILKNILYFGVPAGAESVMFSGGKVVVQTFIMGLGTAAIAANTIVNSVTSLIAVGGNTFGILATTLVGQFIGAGQKEHARTWNSWIAILSSLTFILPIICILPLTGPILGLYTGDAQTLSIATEIMITYLLVCPIIYAPSFTVPAGLRGAGDVFYTMLISIISMWLLRVGASYILTVHLGFGVHGIWWGMYLDWIGRGACFLPRMLGHKWLNKKAVD